MGFPPVESIDCVLHLLTGYSPFLKRQLRSIWRGGATAGLPGARRQFVHSAGSLAEESPIFNAIRPSSAIEGGAPTQRASGCAAQPHRGCPKIHGVGITTRATGEPQERRCEALARPGRGERASECASAGARSKSKGGWNRKGRWSSRQRKRVQGSLNVVIGRRVRGRASGSASGGLLLARKIFQEEPINIV